LALALLALGGIAFPDHLDIMALIMVLPDIVHIRTIFAD